MDSRDNNIAEVHITYEDSVLSSPEKIRQKLEQFEQDDKFLTSLGFNGSSVLDGDNEKNPYYLTILSLLVQNQEVPKDIQLKAKAFNEKIKKRKQQEELKEKQKKDKREQRFIRNHPGKILR